MTSEETDRLNDKDRTDGSAFHQRGLRKNHQDWACRPATSEELAGGLMRRSCELDGPPTQEELEQWRQHGFLPPGRGGRDMTTRQVKQIDLPHVVVDTQNLEKKLVEEISHWKQESQHVPMPLRACKWYYLIFFSGHRRPGDIASWIQAGSDIQPIPIDVAIDKDAGNLLDIQLWLRVIRSGQVLGGHGGPPCETFSEARWLEVETECAPRPLRDEDFPWGRLNLTLKEVKQMVLGSVLFLRTTVLLFAIYCNGGAYTLEHPKGPPPLIGRWCIWHSSFLRRMMKLPDVAKINFVQGPLGRPFWKPTTLCTARLPRLAANIFSKYDRSWRPSQTLGGWCPETRTWRTSAAKAYPERLSQAIAEEILDYSQRVNSEGESTFVPGLEEALTALTQWDPYWFGEGGMMAHDYHPDVQGAQADA